MLFLHFGFLITQIALQKEPIRVEVALTTTEWQMGLMGRKELPEGCGMLFDHSRPLILSYWMKNTKIPLSIGFFDEKRRLLQIEDMLPAQGKKIPIYQSNLPARYALEVPIGWFERHEIKLGALFEWDLGE